MLRAFYYLNVLIVALVVGYKVYLDVFDSKLESVHAQQVELVQSRLAGREKFQFAVVGNVKNSIGIFERQIVPMLNSSGADFVVSAGNAVSDGGEDKYRSLRGTLARLGIPFLLTFGENESSGLGGFRYYRQFGPYFFAFTAGNSRFIFLDGTGETSYEWQLRWLEEELERDEPRHNFIFIGRPIMRPAHEPIWVSEEDYLGPPTFRQSLIDLIEHYDVDAVISDNLPLFDRQDRGGTSYVTTGGAGGLMVRDETGFHHFVIVEVDGDEVSIEAFPLDVSQHPILQTLESLWLFVHSLFFVGYLNFLLILSILILAAVQLHGLVFVDKDYYPRFDVDPSPIAEGPLRVAMFTNNYFPFIGGVPISIDRLRSGLLGLGKGVMVVAPRFDGREGAGDKSLQRSGVEEDGVLRVPSLITLGKDAEYRVANLFLPWVVRRVKAFAPDVIHLHHPFWMGSLGLWIANRLNVPAIYTYHTRFEHFAHYVPVPGRLFRNLISHYVIKRFANRCYGVVVPTPSAREYLQTIGVKRRVIVQPTGIDYNSLRAVDADSVTALRHRLGIGEEPVLVSVSRLSREKNIDFIMEAVSLLRDRLDRPFRLLLIGEGDERPRLEDQVKALGLQDVVIMLGSVPVDLMPLHYHVGDVFVFASTSETQGMVILEAMAAGLPVVAIRASGIDDIVQQGVNGYKTREDRSEWADRVEQLLVDNGLHAEMSQNAVSTASEHDIEPFAREILNFYAAALAERGPKR